MTHPPTEAARKALYATYRAFEVESRVRTKPRPSKGREFAPQHESGASWDEARESLRLVEESFVRKIQAEEERCRVMELIRRYRCPWLR